MNTQFAVFGISTLLMIGAGAVKDSINNQEIELVRIEATKPKPCDSIRYYNLGYAAGVASVEPVILHDTTKVPYPEKFNFHYRDSQAFIYTRNDSVFYKFYTRADSLAAGGRFKKNKIGVKK